jgi:hypothetical protein
MYDTLPEGIFHSYSTSPKKTGKEMATDSKRLKEEETEARKFFHPIDNEILYQRTQLELQEREILSKIVENLFGDFFIEFWKIDNSLPADLISQLLILLPFAHKIAGNLRLTSMCLEAILQTKVNYRNYYEPKQVDDSKTNGNNGKGTLGNSTMGSDMIIGTSHFEVVHGVEFIIGPVDNEKIDAYLADGENARFLNCFFDYFIPFELECSFRLTVEKGQEFKLQKEGPQPVMGYSTVL